VKGHKEFRVVCTDKGAHPSRELAIFAPIPPYNDAGVWVGDAADTGLAWDEWDMNIERNATGVVVYGRTLRSTTDAGTLWRFKCPTCRRDLPLRDTDLGCIVLAFVGAGHQSLDISTRRA
jgi:hypothetical protein